MTEKEMREYIEYLNTLGSHLGLASVIELCKRLGNPQDQLQFVHIAGTNGKGSILNMVSSTLTACGYKTGRYISPTLVDYRERFQINGKMISKKSLGEYVERIKVVCDEMVADGFSHPTSFEFETALSFLYFAKKACDIVVLECGMGGESDATNIVTNTLISTFASISMDHMQFLGKTVEEIAKVKAGIIKPGAYVVTSSQKDSVIEVLREKFENASGRSVGVAVSDSDALNSQMIEPGSTPWHPQMIVADESNLVVHSITSKGMKFSYKDHSKLLLTLVGDYQRQNVTCALEVLDCLRDVYGFHIKEDKIKETFANLTWPGRFEKIASKPDFYMDGAHNAAAARMLRNTLEKVVIKSPESFTNRRIIYIIGILRDKEFEEIISKTYELADCIITVKTPHNERAMDAYELAKVVSRYTANVTAADGLEEAVEMAYLMAHKDDVILAFGSLSFLGELGEIVKNGKWTRRDSHGK